MRFHMYIYFLAKIKKSTGRRTEYKVFFTSRREILQYRASRKGMLLRPREYRFEISKYHRMDFV